MIRVPLDKNVAVSMGNKMMKEAKRRNQTRGTAVAALLLALASGPALAQQPPGTPPTGQSNIPDAPSASRPVEKFPAANETVTPPPPAEITTVPPGGAGLSPGSGRDDWLCHGKPIY